MEYDLTETDEGKTVVDATGETIGVVSAVRSGTAYVDPDPGLTERLRSRLGWENVDQDDYALDESEIDTVTDKEIRLRNDH